MNVVSNSETSLSERPVDEAVGIHTPLLPSKSEDGQVTTASTGIEKQKKRSNATTKEKKKRTIDFYFLLLALILSPV